MTPHTETRRDLEITPVKTQCLSRVHQRLKWGHLPLKLREILCLKYDMMDGQYRRGDIIPVECKCPHGPVGHLLQGELDGPHVAGLQHCTHKEVLNIGNVPATTPSELPQGTKRVQPTCSYTSGPS